MYQALYRKYRPQTFDDVVGQMAVTQTLKTQLNSGKLSHAYLFTGSRGTGKTSSAKILAKAVNCENPQGGNPCNCCAACRSIDAGSCMDVLEIDAASNSGVDNVRDLRDDAVYTPSQVKKRVYIIDEVHMLSISAFNALLKIIEEPPEHLLFILATTELHKVPATILSRCQRFSFRRISQEDITARLQYVAYQENIDLDESAARILARLADGGMRDALSLLDQCASATDGALDAKRVNDILGIAGIAQCGSLMACIAQHDTKGALSILNRLYAEGKDMGALLDELSCLTRDFLILKTAPGDGIGMLSGVASDEEVKHMSTQFSSGQLTRMMNVIRSTVVGFGRSESRRMDAELCIVNLCQPELDTDMDSVLARLTRVEDSLRSGTVSVNTAPAPVVEDKQDTPVTVQQEQLFQADTQPEMETEPTEITPEEEPQGSYCDETPMEEVPVGFWTDVAASVRKELNPVLTGFFATTPNAPMQGVMEDGKLLLVCENEFVMDIVNKPEILALVAQKASAKLGRSVQVKVTDQSRSAADDDRFQQLLSFGRAHSDVINIKERN